MLLKNKVTFEELKVVKTAQPQKGVQLLHPVSLKIITPYKRLQLDKIYKRLTSIKISSF